MHKDAKSALQASQSALFGPLHDLHHRDIKIAKWKVTLSYNYTMRFIGYDSIETRWFISYRFQIHTIMSIQKNRDDKSHRVIVALFNETIHIRKWVLVGASSITLSTFSWLTDWSCNDWSRLHVVPWHFSSNGWSWRSCHLSPIVTLVLSAIFGVIRTGYLQRNNKTWKTTVLLLSKVSYQQEHNK